MRPGVRVGAGRVAVVILIDGVVIPAGFLIARDWRPIQTAWLKLYTATENFLLEGNTMNKLALIITIVLVVLTVVPMTTEAVDVERDALMALYDSTDGANWTNNSGWGAGNPCDSAWFGVTCGADGVTWLDLSYNQLIGPIPTELGNLSSLVGVALNNNQLSGSIPTDLGNLSS